MMAKQQKANQSPESTDENIVRKLTQLCEPKEEKEEEKQKEEKRKIFFKKIKFIIFIIFTTKFTGLGGKHTKLCSRDGEQYRQINKPLQTIGDQQKNRFLHHV